MSYTNVTIYNLYSTEWTLRKKNADLEHELKWTQNMLARVQKELENIPEAIKQHGYVDIRYDGEQMRIIKESK
jgi:hypothetical protein